MTEQDFLAQQSNGKIEVVAPTGDDAALKTGQKPIPTDDDIMQLLRSVKRNFTTDPAFIPQNSVDQIQFVNNALKFWVNGAWRGAGGLNVKVGGATRTAGSTGSQAVTGVGFQPKAIIFLGMQGTSADRYLVSIVDGTTTKGTQWDSVAGKFYSYNGVFEYRFSAGNSVSATLTSLDSDGFTLNWVAVSNNWDWFYLAIG